MNEPQNSVREAATGSSAQNNTQKIRIKFGKKYREYMNDAAVACCSKWIINKHEKKKYILMEFVKIKNENENDSDFQEAPMEVP